MGINLHPRQPLSEGETLGQYSKGGTCSAFFEASGRTLTHSGGRVKSYLQFGMHSEMVEERCLPPPGLIAWLAIGPHKRGEVDVRKACHN